MKKIILFGYFFLCAIGLSLTACGGSDSSDDNPGGGTSNTDAQLKASIVGTWRLISEDQYKKDLLYFYWDDGITYGGQYGGPYVSWVISDGKMLKTRKDGRVEEYSVKVEGNKMYTHFGDYSFRDGEIVDASEHEVLERVTDLTLPALNAQYFVGTWTRTITSASETQTYNADGTGTWESKSYGGYTPITQTGSLTWDFNSHYLSVVRQSLNRRIIISATENSFVLSDYWPEKYTETWTRVR